MTGSIAPQPVLTPTLDTSADRAPTNVVQEEEPIPCPRCRGSGYMTRADIQRLSMIGRWRPGACRYCDGIGWVSAEQLRTRGVTAPPP